MRMNSRIAIALLSALAMFSMSSSVAQEKVARPEQSKKTRVREDVLIVYVSRTENTSALARMIRDATGGDLVELELETPYPEDYDRIVLQVDRENKRGYLPPLKTRVKDFGRYSVVFLGFPTWDMQMPPPMKSFLSTHDLSGKKVAPFNTNAGYGVGKGFDQVKALCPNSRVMPGFSTRGGHEKEGVMLTIQKERANEVRVEVERWLKSILEDAP